MPGGSYTSVEVLCGKWDAYSMHIQAQLSQSKQESTHQGYWTDYLL